MHFQHNFFWCCTFLNVLEHLQGWYDQVQKSLSWQLKMKYRKPHTLPPSWDEFPWAINYLLRRIPLHYVQFSPFHSTFHLHITLWRELFDRIMIFLLFPSCNLLLVMPSREEVKNLLGHRRIKECHEALLFSLSKIAAVYTTHILLTSQSTTSKNQLIILYF